MPVYLCQPGSGSQEPWRHGIQVYAAPFAMDTESPLTRGGRDVISLPGPETEHDPAEPTTAMTSTQPANHSPTRPRHGMPIRRVRHAEVVLVDDACIAFDRYWLRLRWPGHKGGFAGYIALGRVGANHWGRRSTPREISLPIPSFPAREGFPAEEPPQRSSGPEDRATSEDADVDDPTRDDEPQDNNSTPSAEPFEEKTSDLICLRTGLAFPSSMAMKLLAVYEDGMVPPVASAPLPSEPVFCRICREGLHDDADEQQPSPAMEDGNEGETPRQSQSPNVSSNNLLERENEPSEPKEEAPVVPVDSVVSPVKGPIQPHPRYQPNPHAAENPLLAPCECSGSMAFVHYLCVEQWRCRSRHPEAHHGLNCETCGGAYALPPPSARPAAVPQMENEDWLEAMPPHVMAALRQPHIWWQIGAAIVRRRWLRPIAPVIMSPMVALYCRARRLLKKRGVARRRWACSLCRRRARWKCVRCLRSYYCSRQCQNVSWHIVHKHVCYKPARFWWSVVVYGIVTLLVFPGILRDPLMYDLGLGLIPTSFLLMGIMGGGIATLFKKVAGLDLRGRTFELIVVLMTAWLVAVSWGLVRGFFGDTSKCYGVLGSLSLSPEDPQPLILKTLRALLLRPAQSWFLMWDRFGLYTGPWLTKAICISEPEIGCFEHLPHANPDFFFREHEGERCASDLLTVTWVWISSVVCLAGSTALKRRERQRRALARRLARDEPRPHQD